MKVKFIEFLNTTYVAVDGEIRGRLVKQYDGKYVFRIIDISYPLSRQALTDIVKYMEELNGA